MSQSSQDGRSRLSEQEVRDDRSQVSCLERLGLRFADTLAICGTNCYDIRCYDFGSLVVVVTGLR